MAYESRYWRTILKRDATYLEKKILLGPVDIEDDIDRHFSYVEIKVMTLAYIIRKLADTKKLPDELLKKKFKLEAYKRNKKEISRSYVDIEKQYDLSKKIDIELQLRKICNQIIHSYVLQAIGCDKSAFCSVWFVSDYDKEKHLYEMSLKTLIKVARTVANTHVVSMSSRYDEEIGDWIHELK